MQRRHPVPILLGKDGKASSLSPLDLGGSGRSVSEAVIRDLIAAHPECLPITEIDPSFKGAVTVCTELATPAGSVDVFLITPSGLPVLVECKLWRNPESRREVVGHIIDYARALAGWTCSDLQREANKRLGRQGNCLLEIARSSEPDLDEIDFNDAVSLNLRRGRFLLLVVGDGIRQDVERIAEFLQQHAGLHFTFGLVEMPLFECPDGSLLIAPRVVVGTELIKRTVIALPEGTTILDEGGADEVAADPLTAERLSFWSDLIAGLDFDDPEQPRPKPTRQGYISLMLPAPSGSSWITVYRDLIKGEVGLYLSYSRNSAGERVAMAALDEWNAISPELGPSAVREMSRDGRELIIDRLVVGRLDDPTNRTAALVWLRRRANDFVNVFRPRVRALLIDQA